MLTKLNLSNPAQSLLLTKATAQVSHGGGNQLTLGSPGYNQLLAWIQNGAQF